MNLDIHTAIQTALVIAVVASILSVWYGIRSIRKARKLPFFRMRRVMMTRGWRLLVWGIFLAVFALLLNSRIEPIIYRFYPPTATFTFNSNHHPDSIDHSVPHNHSQSNDYINSVSLEYADDHIHSRNAACCGKHV